jgi:hypothetical protein
MTAGEAGPDTPPPGVPPEMPRPFPLAKIGDGARFLVEATPAECRALAGRMGLAELYALTCRFDLRRHQADVVEAQGQLRARVRQTCVVSLDEFDADVGESFTIRFVPRGAEASEVDLDAADEVTYDGSLIDLGEAASEQLALALEPFPRLPGAELPGGAQDHDTNPFAALGKLLPR